MYKESKIEISEKGPGTLRIASETFLANLPILVCGMAVAFTLLGEFL